MKRPRLPTDEERALWRETTRHDAKMRKDSKPSYPLEGEPKRAERDAVGGKIHTAPHPPTKTTKVVLTPQGGSKAPVPLAKGDTNHTDRNTARRLKRGELPIEATLDLHGLTREEAYILLKRRMAYWTKHGKRCVCIITGKGRLSEGVLKRELPGWLNEPALRAHIIAFAPAPHRLGGEGAVLVLLRRMR